MLVVFLFYFLFIYVASLYIFYYILIYFIYSCYFLWGKNIKVA